MLSGVLHTTVARLLTLILLAGGGCVSLGGAGSAPPAPNGLAALDQSLRGFVERSGAARFAQFSRVRAQLTDRRSSWGARLGSPYARDQRLQVALDLRERSLRARLVGGGDEGAIVGIKGGLAYRLREGERDYASDPELERALGSIRRYVTLPQQLAARLASELAKAPGDRSLEILDPRDLSGQTFDRLRLSADDARVPESLEAWIGRASGRLEWVELSRPGLLGCTSYTAIHFLESVKAEGIPFPSAIEIVSDIGEAPRLLRRLELSELRID